MASDGESQNAKFAAFVAAAILAGAGGNLGLSFVAPSVNRADPFTGREGENLQRQIDDLRAECKRLGTKFEMHDREAYRWKQIISVDHERIKQIEEHCCHDTPKEQREDQM